MYRSISFLLFLFLFLTGYSFAQLSGTYTIGSGGSYPTFSSAVTALTSQGVNGSVTFSVISGTYNEHILIPAISGASAANTITFQSQSGSASDVTMTYSSTDAASNYLIKLDGAGYITFQNLTFSPTGTSYSTSIDLSNAAHHISISNNIFNGNTSGNGSGYHSVIYAYNSQVNNVTIENCTISNGSYGIYFSGINTTSAGAGNRFLNNILDAPSSYGFYLAYQSSPVISGNEINGSPGYGMYLLGCNNALELVKNKVTAASYGMYVYSCTGGTGTGTARGLIANNFISSTGSGGNGLFMYSSSNQDIYHNSIIFQAGNVGTSCLYVYAGGANNIQNNNLMNNGSGHAIEIYSPAAVNVCDYNNLFTTGNYLGSWNNVDQYDLADYQAASGKEAHSVSVYPNFSSLSDLHTTSPWLNGKAAPLSRVLTDIDGDTRNGSTPDIGADEYTPGAGTTTPLAGVYTIGGSSPDYATVADAITDLLLKGISDSVSMEIRNGSYEVNEILYTVPGSGIGKPVVFRSATGNRDNVTLYHIASGANDNFVFYLKGSDFFRFEDLGFTSNDIDNTTYSTSLYLTGGVNYLHLIDCKLSGSNSGSANAALFYTYQAIGKFRYITGNQFNYGSSGIYQSGLNTTQPNTGSMITGNEFNNQRSYGAYLIYDNDLKLKNNVVNNAPAYGFYLQSCEDEMELTGNRLSAASYGLYLYDCSGGTGLTIARGLVANNFIYSVGTGGGGLHSYSSSNFDFFHNSIIHQNGNTGTYCLYVYAGSANNIQNNNLMHNGNGYAIQIYSPSAVNTCDYNNLFSTGNYLGSWANSDQYDLADYQSTSGKEAHSVSVYPHFLTTTDLHSDSPWLNGKGTVLSRVMTDIDGEARNGSTPDIGADEFTPGAGTTTPLAGVYTIGGSSPDYATVSDAVADLLLKGVSDSVSLEIRTGSYNVSQVLYTVPGSGRNTPVIFRSESGNRDNVNLYHVAAGAGDNFVFYLQGADFIRFKSLGLTSNDADNAAYSTSLQLFGGVDGFQLMDCKLNGANSGSSNAALFYAYQSNGKSRYISGNQFNFGSYGIYQSGWNNNQPNTGSMILSNDFYSQRTYGAYILYEKGLKLKNNMVNNSPNYAFYIQNCDDALEVTGNHISASSYAMYIYSCTGGTGLGAARGLIANNFISNNGGGGSGLYLYNSANQDVYHNSIIHLYGNSGSSALYVYAGSGNNIQNNNLMHNAYGYAADIYSPSAVNICDYNNLFSNGNYLGNWANAAQYNLTDYQGASGKETHSLSVYPLFTSLFDLHTGSPWLDGKAAVLSRVITDIDGQARNGSTPDIGADEFMPAAGTTTPLSGVYKIGGSSPDYTSVSDAVADLLLKGISDSVSMEIRSGSYDINQVLHTIPGSGVDKPVVFRSESGNRDDVSLYHIATDQNDNFIFSLKGADFIRFHNLGFAGNNAANATYSTSIHLEGGVDHFHLNNCKLNGANNGSTNAALYYAYQSIGKFRYIKDNQFNHGSYGIYQYGVNTNQPNTGTIISGNEFNNQRTYGTYFLYDQNLKVFNNTVNHSPTYGMYFQSCDGELEVTGNRVNGSGYAIYIYSCTGGTGLVTERGLVANNFIFNSGASGSGLYLYSVTNQDIYHNSVLNTSGNSGSSAFYIYAGNGNNVVNNVFMNKGAGFAYYVASAGAINTSDYNDIYTYGPNVGYWGGNLATLVEFQGAGSTDANSKSTNPGFISNSDLHAVSSLLDSAGTPLTRVLYDIDGEMRNATHPDIGADEFDSTAVVGIAEDALARNRLPKEFKVYDNYPNPFNPTTYIKYDLPAAEHVKLEVYNMLGQLVTRLVDQQQNAGSYILPFNAVNLATGTYFYRLQAGQHSVVRKMTLNK